MNLNNFYFIIKFSPWPLIIITNIINFIFNLILFLNYKFNLIFIILIIIIINSLILWINHLYTINFKLNYYNTFIKLTKKIFLIIFILSEIIFFLSFFYINFSIYYFNNFILNFNNLKIFNLNFFIALINSLILINSSLTFILALINNLQFIFKNYFYLNLTIILRFYFIIIQLFEYKIIQFNISNSILFSNFFILTSFHIIHVIIGLMIINLFKIFKLKLINLINIEFKIICLYWHFIDLIWILIFLLLY